MKRHRRDIAPITAINLTSLLDVAFVLLIAFILVAPSLKYGLELELPQISAGAPQLAQDQQNLFTITIPKGAGGGAPQELLMNSEPVKLADIEQRLALQKKNGREVAVEIEADGKVHVETFLDVVAAVQRAGIQTVGLPVAVDEALTTLPPKGAPGKS